MATATLSYARQAASGQPCLPPAGRPARGDPVRRRRQMLRRRRRLAGILSTHKSPAAARNGKEEKKSHPTTPPPPPAKTVAGDPVPGRRPTDPAATCLCEGLDPAPETWDHLPQTPLSLGGQPDHRGPRILLMESVGQPPVGLARLGGTRSGAFCNSIPLLSTPVTIRPPVDWLDGWQVSALMVATPPGAINRSPPGAAGKLCGLVHV